MITIRKQPNTHGSWKAETKANPINRSRARRSGASSNMEQWVLLKLAINFTSYPQGFGLAQWRARKVTAQIPAARPSADAR